MPSLHEMAKFRDENYAAHQRWYWAMQALYKRGELGVVLYMNDTPAVVVSKWVTAACLFHMGYGPKPVRDIVKIELVVRRLLGAEGADNGS